LREEVPQTQKDIIHGCEGEHGDSKEDSQLDSLYAVEGRGSVSGPLHEYVILFPTLSLIEPPDQHHIMGHVVTFPPGVRPQGCGYIAATKKTRH
jgi:hypothetical protein